MYNYLMEQDKSFEEKLTEEIKLLSEWFEELQQILEQDRLMQAVRDLSAGGSVE